jgi:molybdopterin-guanine dinucleotide biosynthesis protein B
MLPIDEILKHYDHDFVILEGVTDCNVPRILTAHSEQEIAEVIDGRAVAVSGVFSNDHSGEILGRPIMSPLTEADRLVDFVLEHAFEPLPNCDPECCSACGFDCRAFAGEVAHKRAPRSGCVLTSQDVELLIDGRPITMVPFVQNILKNAVMGVVSELEGHKETAGIEVRFKL